MYRVRMAALLAPAMLCAGVRLANAQDATWIGGAAGNNYGTTSNWSPVGAPPSGTATFSTSASDAVAISYMATVGAWNFTGTSAYTFAINGTGSGIIFTGTGINIGGGSASITNNGTVEFENSSTAGNASIINNAVTSFLDSSSAGAATITNNGLLEFSGASTAGNATITTNAGAAAQFHDATSGGNARFITNLGGSFDISALSSTGMTAGPIEGAGNYFLGSKTLTVGGNNRSTTVSGTISDGGIDGGIGGSLVKVGTGTLTLSGIDTYTGATAINGGTLEVDGSIASSSSVAVNSGGTLSGTGIVGPVTVASGGTLAPGNAGNPTGILTIAGNLAFQSGALYVVQVTSSASSSVNVSGTATLTGATVNAQFATGSYVARQYIIVSAASGVTGTFGGLINTSLPAGFTESLSYSSTKVFLNLTANLGASDPPPGGATTSTTTTTTTNNNQQTIVTVLNNYFNYGGSLSSNFISIFGLSGNALINAISQLDGEAATGAERSTFQLGNEFLGLMLDPFVNGRGYVGGAGFVAVPGPGCVPPPDAAILTLNPPVTKDCAWSRAVYEPRWSAWGSAFGGTTNANGTTAAGSNNITANTFGFAGGMDYHVTPTTIFGFALAGAGTNWGLANALGNGHSDALQVGAYGINWFGPAYVAGALAFTNSWFTTSRSALGDQLSATFQGQSYGARAEGGYRFAVAPWFGVTPYGALQLQDFHTPAYSEVDGTGGGFGLAYASANATDVRTELGSRFDAPTIIAGRPVVLYGRLAWAHDFVDTPFLNASFQALPGSSFTVTGAPIAANSALTTIGAQIFLTPNWSLLGKFDGEFASGSQTYAGSGTLRYTW
jgi:autotransporter-associated beta strand protein